MKATHYKLSFLCSINSIKILSSIYRRKITTIWTIRTTTAAAIINSSAINLFLTNTSTPNIRIISCVRMRDVDSANLTYLDLFIQW